jgi:DNA repair protein RadC
MGKIIDEKVDEQIHSGRREKLRASFTRYGLETFNETQVLEFALGMVIPRMDTNPTAHRLINTFGNLDGVISASIEKLQSVPGMGAVAANFLHFLKQFTIYIAGVERKHRRIKTPTEAIDVLRSVMKFYPVEHFVVVCLDAGGNIILHKDLRGDIDRVGINTREVIDLILRVATHSVIFAHNHPNGAANPSDADVALTRSLAGVLTPLGVNIVDHIIFASDNFYSFTLNGVLDILRRETREFQTAKRDINLGFVKPYANTPK